MVEMLHIWLKLRFPVPGQCRRGVLDPLQADHARGQVRLGGVLPEEVLVLPEVAEAVEGPAHVSLQRGQAGEGGRVVGAEHATEKGRIVWKL